jgi:hypothetical protein
VGSNLARSTLFNCFSTYVCIYVLIRSVRRLLVVAPSSPSLVTLMMEAIRSSVTSVLTRATRRNIQENCILRMYVKVFS